MNSLLDPPTPCLSRSTSQPPRGTRDVSQALPAELAEMAEEERRREAEAAEMFPQDGTLV